MSNKNKKHFRIEKDTIGRKKVPEDVYYGIQTLRAVENFPISGIRQKSIFVCSTSMVKMAAAETNMKLGLLDKRRGKAITRAAKEIIKGKFHDQFIVDVYQAGAGTSHNMNVNEVIANRAIEILGGAKGDNSIVHPNDHVNMSQSTNDTYPTAMRIALLFMLQDLIASIKFLEDALNEKAREFGRIVKSARTHLQDAVPIMLGREFKGYSTAIFKSRVRVECTIDALTELGIGATAAGTGINTPPGYRREVIYALKRITAIKGLKPSEDMVEAISSMLDFQRLSSELKGLALQLIRLANDLRLMSSGPRTGFNEITLPAVQPGSSIMPGKVNPVLAEMLNMVCFQVVGNDLTVSMATQAGQFELNVMMPVISYNLLQSIEILKNSISVFTSKCVKGIKANPERCKEMAENSIGLAAVLNPYIGYDAAASIVNDALKKKKTIREIMTEKEILSLQGLSLFPPHRK
jgi:aspartate ammonia-lyase